MRILFIVNSFGVGGAEKQIVSLAKEHSLRGNQVLIVRLKSKPDDLLSKITFCQTESLEMNGFKGALCCFSNFNRLVKNFKPDVIHSHLPHSIVFSRFYKLIYGGEFRLVCTAHSYNIRTRLFGLFYKYTDFISDHNTNVSQSAVERYIKEGVFSSGKSTYIPNGFEIVSDEVLSKYSRNDILKELDFTNNNYICCAIGRLGVEKNYPMMLHALKHANSIDASYKLIIIGDGPEKDALVNLSEELELSDSVRFLGLIDDVYKYLSISDLYLMSSIFEGMPLAICEAMIAKKPMIVTDFPGVAEFTKDYYPIIGQNESVDFGNSMLKAKVNNDNYTLDAAKDDIVELYSIGNVVSRWMVIYEGE